MPLGRPTYIRTCSQRNWPIGNHNKCNFTVSLFQPIYGVGDVSNTQHFAANNVTENNYSSSSPPLPPPIEESRPAAETQLHDVYNRHHASSSLANALVSPTDGVIPPRTGNSDSSRAATNSQSTVGLSGTTTVSSDQRQTYPGVPQAANALVRVSEQHPSVGPSQAPNIVVKTTVNSCYIILKSLSNT